MRFKGRSWLAGAAMAAALTACVPAEGSPPGPNTTVAPDQGPASTETAPATTSQASTTSTTVPPTTDTPTTVPPTTLPPITIGFAGDTSFTHGLDRRDPLGEMTQELSAPDLMIVNLETTVAEASVGKAIEKRFTFKSPPITASLLADAGVDVAALANNHALDYGPDAVMRTIEILNEGGIATVGTGADPSAAYSALRVDVQGWDVAVLSFSRVPCDSPEPGEKYIDEVAWACPQFEAATLAAVEAAADADFTIVMVHWGIQRQECPADHQHDLATSWIVSGADAVVGSHPHILQGVEKIGDKWVLHSTGNFAFPSARNASSYTAMFQLTVATDSQRLVAIPARIEEGRPVRAVSSRQGILDDLTERSFGFTFGEDGEAVASPGTGKC